MNDSVRLNQLTEKARDGVDLTMKESALAIQAMIRLEASEEEMADFLIALSDKGEAMEELAGAAAAIRNDMQRVRTNREVVIDTCGTGGDHSGTFNISTAAAMVAAAAGIAVAKHGNRAITSQSGSADVLRRLGVNIAAPLHVVEACLEELGICFCFAPQLHPAVGNVSHLRRRLGRRTLFNWLGPLCNPANAPYQLLGVGKPELRPVMAGALRKLGTKRGVVVSGADGLDEITLADATLVSQASEEGIVELTWQPEDFGIVRAPIDSLKVDGCESSAQVIRSVLQGNHGPHRDIVVLNAAAALWVGKVESDLVACRIRVEEAIDSGAASRLLKRLARRTNQGSPADEHLG